MASSIPEVMPIWPAHKKNTMNKPIRGRIMLFIYYTLCTIQVANVLTR